MSYDEIKAVEYLSVYDSTYHHFNTDITTAEIGSILKKK